MNEFIASEIDSALDRLLEAHDIKISREFDAAACGTSYDFRRADEARDEFWKVKDQVIDELAGMIKTK
jgi:hypothetical protein